MENELYDFGMIGLGVMGSNLLQNMAAHSFRVTGYDKDQQKVSLLQSLSTENAVIKGAASIEIFVQQLKSPRKMMMLVPAGKPVDAVIENLLPLLSKGDILIDGGNSHYTDTLRRVIYLQQHGIHFMGMGISGGEQGARTGPSIMPGGDEEAWHTVKPLLEAIAAKANGEPCVAYMGKDAAGHYVKMVHNGIEYAIMQLLSEVYDILKRGLSLTNDELHEVFKQWNQGELEAFLIAITRDIFLQVDDVTGNRLLDMILDVAGSKGTGKWTSQDAMDLPVSIPTIDMAVAMRDLSIYKEERIWAAALHKPVIKNITDDKNDFIQKAGEALYAGMLICYAQGLSMLHKASSQLQMNIPLQDVVKVWRAGCIIRSEMLEMFYKAYTDEPQLPNLLLNNNVAKTFQAKEQSLRYIIIQAIQSGISVAGLSGALAYYDAYTNEHMPVNLIQAQRDYFGAHTYQRIDMPGNFHTEWKVEY
ncbi:MAG: NADP-dependent phosphogluconate dehydrogenase [Parafilimonas sp.]